MRAHPYTSVLAAAVGVALAAAPAAAQHASASSATVRPVAAYELRVGLPDRTMPAKLVVADSAGALVASLRRAADGAAIPLIVNVEGSDLVLHADTPDGLLELVLHRQNESAARSRVTGRWTLGQQQGALQGRVR
jgi:hypothetical protein